jgi:branched-chain amino acid transport system permease protein
MALFMATVGLSIFLEGLAQGLWGLQVRGLDLGVSDAPIFLREYFGDNFDILISKFDLVTAAIAAVMVASLALFFQKTKTGLSLRAVSQDNLAALAVGVPLSKVWAIVWAATGVIALIAGMLWGARTGVSFSLTEVVLKGLPAILIGGFGSIPGAILGGLIVGLSENLGEIYIAPLLGGQGIGNWFVYAVTLIFLMLRPSGLFGDKRIVRA